MKLHLLAAVLKATMVLCAQIALTDSVALMHLYVLSVPALLQM